MRSEREWAALLNEVAFGLVAPEEIPDLEKPLPSKNVLFSLDETLRKRCTLI
jgi:hypothetical protein